ncbi:MAG TPA: hypothetical protein VHD36_06480 [Pirellulales bacterium]|nr:hypothetical protein [Pirellulales bacterium]
MSLRRLLPALVVGVLLVSCGSTAKAQWGFGGGFGWGGWGWANGAYTLDPPPYFSLFPPVYYSHVTPRPYGFSPFAYPGFMPTPERIRMPSTPYVPPRRQARSAPATNNTAWGPIIKNPFVLPEDDRPSRLSDGRPAPQTVTTQEVAAASTGQIDIDK